MTYETTKYPENKKELTFWFMQKGLELSLAEDFANLTWNSCWSDHPHDLFDEACSILEEWMELN